MNAVRKAAIAAAACLWLGALPAAAAQRTVNIAITDHGFQPSHVVAVINQPVQLKITNRGRKVHQFSIPYYRIYTSNLSPGQSSTVGFSPWTAGRFEMTSDPSGENRPEFTGHFYVTEHK